MNVKVNLYPCAHCERTGTCSRAANGAACAACVKNNNLKGSGHVGLPCGICGGLGHAEPKTERINKRMQPILAILTLYFLMAAVLISAAVESQYFTEILAFASPLVGVVLAFYFTARGSPRP
ncbi:hypothetical protein [Pseudomonas batumici]|uniref:hypothetical protein n=1 Tax=Pseudomonas batumici TaxID=226910 RepID=UPI000589C580|nr:hypothetical protein [Pseudomonas batumici]